MRRLLLIPVFVIAACGSDAKGTEDARADAPIVVDGGAPDASCFTNPTTHHEIINACTNAQFVDKNPTLPLRLPDGGLPPLP